MDIKEIALRLLAEEFPGMHQENQAFMVEFAEALISAYKAELLKEAGEPVAYRFELKAGEYGFTKAKYACNVKYAANQIALYTSDQVAAAVLKATKPLEERRCEICGYAEHHREHTGCLRTKLAAAQEEIANETAEAIASFVDTTATYDTSKEIAEAIRRGAWKGFKK